MFSPFPKPRPRGAETLLSPPPPLGRSMFDDMAREVNRGTGRQVVPPPQVERQAANLGADVGSLAMPQEPQLGAVSPKERELFELLGATYNRDAVAAVRAMYAAGPLAIESDYDPGFTFAGRATAEYATADVAIERLKGDAKRLESEALTAPSYAVDSLQRAAAELRARIAKIEALAPGVFALRLARRLYERAIEAERLARTAMSVAETKAAAIVAGPTEAIRIAKIDADNVLAGPIRAHANTVAALDAAEMGLKRAQERV